MHITILDDHLLFCKTLALALHTFAEKVEWFTKPTEMMTSLQSQQPDILLLDIRGDTWCGLNIAKEILFQFPSAKIVFLSGYELEYYKGTAKLLGAKGFIHKSVTIETLKREILLVKEGGNLLSSYRESREVLTRREREILQLLALGHTQESISFHLSISRRTVCNHLSSIYEKLDVSSAVSAVTRGIELGVLSLQNRKEK